MAAAEQNGDSVAGFSTGVWLEHTSTIAGYEDGTRMGLRAHLDEAIAQNANLVLLVLDNIPNKNCGYPSVSGELLLIDDGYSRYAEDFIDPITAILGDPAYAELKIAVVFGRGSLANLVTNLDDPGCAELEGPGGYIDAVHYTLNQLNTLSNVYVYLDIAHSGWLGWNDNFAIATTLYYDVIESANAGVNSIAGFAANVAYYSPLIEPYLPDPQLAIGGIPIRASDFYEWNNYFDELSYASDFREAMISKGMPETIGLLIDTGRNGWGDAQRPTAVSDSDDLNTYVDESRIDHRSHRFNWCNQPGGIGARPQAAPLPGVDAFAWIWPPGLSDGISEPGPQDPHQPNLRYDRSCSPTEPLWMNPIYGTNAMPGAPHAGNWFPEHFQLLLENAWPKFDE